MAAGGEGKRGVKRGTLCQGHSFRKLWLIVLKQMLGAKLHCANLLREREKRVDKVGAAVEHFLLCHSKKMYQVRV